MPGRITAIPATINRHTAAPISERIIQFLSFRNCIFMAWMSVIGEYNAVLGKKLC